MKDKEGRGSDGRATESLPVIPEGELPCVWMLSGEVSYKLCDRDYRCETCPLDIELRHSQKGSPRPDASGGPAGRVGFYHYPTHIWVQPTGEDTALVGVDQFIAALLVEADGVVLPRVGTSLRHTDWLAIFVFHREVVELPSPVSGVVLDTNIAMVGRLDTLAKSCYGDGWLVEVRVPNMASELEFSIPHHQVNGWLGEQMKKLDRRIGLAIGTRSGLNALAQNGLLRFDLLKRSLGPKKYAKLVRSIIGA